MSESIVFGSSSKSASPIKILDVTWADWLNNVPNKICYRLGNYCFIKVKYYIQYLAIILIQSHPIFQDIKPILIKRVFQ